MQRARHLSPQEAFAMLANQYVADSQLMLEFAKARWDAGHRANADQFLLIAEYLSGGRDRVELYVLRPGGTLVVTEAAIERDDWGLRVIGCSLRQRRNPCFSQEPHVMTAFITEFRDACSALPKHVGDRYGVSVEVASIRPPLKGDLDGSRILVGDHNTDEERLFLVAHLFGHTVQWNVSADLRRLGMTMPVKPTSAELDALEAYEREACRYSQQVLHHAGITGFDQWLADYSACDLAFLRHLYTTGERLAFREFWMPGQPLIAPLAIPPFTPTRWRRREQAIIL